MHQASRYAAGLSQNQHRDRTPGKNLIYILKNKLLFTFLIFHENTFFTFYEIYFFSSVNYNLVVQPTGDGENGRGDVEKGRELALVLSV